MSVSAKHQGPHFGDRQIWSESACAGLNQFPGTGIHGSQSDPQNPDMKDVCSFYFTWWLGGIEG